MPVVEIYRSTSRRSAALGLPAALSMNSPSPYVSAAQFISPSSTLVFLTLKPMLRYQSTVALTSGTWIIGVTVLIREPPAGAGLPDNRGFACRVVCAEFYAAMPWNLTVQHFSSPA